MAEKAACDQCPGRDVVACTKCGYGMPAEAAEANEMRVEQANTDLRRELKHVKDHSEWKQEVIERHYRKRVEAEAKLETLRSGLNREIDKLWTTANSGASHPFVAQEARSAAYALTRLLEVSLLDASEDTEKPGFSDGWRGALNQAMEIGQAQGISLAVLHDYLDGGDGHSGTPDYTVHWDGKPTAEERAALDEVVEAAYKKMSGEDTEKQSGGITQLTPKQRETISTVQGHLEGYADALGWTDSPSNIETLIQALREDAKKLKQSGGGEGS